MFKKGYTPWNKGKTGVYSDEMLEKMRQARKGKKASKETREKIRQANLGNTNALGKKYNNGKNHPKWKGDNAGKLAMHKWVERQKGKAKDYKCIFCSKQALDWANKDHTYKRALDDYMALCRKCHAKYDKTL